MESPVHQKFSAALDALIERVKDDRSIVAAILCGSLSHDTVWARSDIDLALVTIDDKKIETGEMALYADGINVHAFLIPRARFRQVVDGAVRNSFMHSLLAKGRLLYTHDPTVADLCATLTGLGERDTRMQLLQAGASALPMVYKAHKWFITRADLDYTALWILYAAGSLARIEVISRRLLADREVLPQALALNPAFFKTIYTDLLNAKKTRPSVHAALDAVDAYIAERTPTLFAAVFDYLIEAGDVRTAREIEAHFERHFAVNGVMTVCEYLADQGLIGKASTAVHLTKKSHTMVEELGFVHVGKAPTL